MTSPAKPAAPAAKPAAPAAPKVAPVAAVPQIADQGWSKREPVIPEELKDTVKVVVFACPAKHKTKATTQQISTGVKCCECGAPAKAMPQFVGK